MNQNCLHILENCDQSSALQDLKALRDLMMDPQQQANLGQNMGKEFFQKVVIDQIGQYVIQDSFYQLTLFYMQFLCNFITGNQLNKDFLLINLKSDKLMSFYEKHENEKVVRSCWMLVFNMIKNNPDKEALLFDHLFVHKNVYEKFTPLIMKLISDPSSQIEWATYFLNEVFSVDYKLKRSFLELILMNCDQTYYFIYHMMSKTIDERQTSSLVDGILPTISDIRELYEQDTKQKLGIVISQLDFQYLMNHYQKVQQVLMIQFDQIEEVKFNTLVEEQNKLLRIFCLITFMGGFNKQLQEQLHNTFILALDVLVKIKQLYDLKTLRENLEKETYEDIISIFLRFIGNVIHINPEAQQVILKSGTYVKTVLGFTKIDEEQSQMREWSTVLIRNLSEGNPDFKQIIDDQYMVQ